MVDIHQGQEVASVTKMAEPHVNYGTIGSFSGPIIKGTIDAFSKIPTMEDAHIDRAFWLTTMVESGGKAGAIMAADGTGMTASLEQLVAVYPRQMDEQGSLFGILQYLTSIIDITTLLPFNDVGWKLVHGILCTSNGKPVTPKKIRDTFTPIEGHVPVSGPRWEQSKKWALAFHRLFTQPETIPLQIDYGIEQFITFANKNNPRLNKASVNLLAYNRKIAEPNPFENVTINDLAMSVWWSYKVNGPTPALDALFSAYKQHSEFNDPDFGARLIFILRTNSYGRWATNRYDRTRQYARTVWPDEFFNGKDAVMPAR